MKDEKVINAANISARFGSQFRITGITDPNEARQLSLLLRAGALIAPIQIVEERTIGPTLGLQNIEQGLKACLAGLFASILFMIIYYRKFGLIASTALFANLIMIVGVMSLLPGATLTMPGIAGIVLTLAVAVDANVLINERIKEELRNGRSVQQSIHEGYKGAFKYYRRKPDYTYHCNYSVCSGYRVNQRLCNYDSYRCRHLYVYSYYWYTCYREPAIWR